jgi:hypothetical protein
MSERFGQKWRAARESDPQYCQMKADQHWDMAGLARQDGDKADEERQTKLARDWQAKAAEARRQ